MLVYRFKAICLHVFERSIWDSYKHFLLMTLGVFQDCLSLLGPSSAHERLGFAGGDKSLDSRHRIVFGHYNSTGHVEGGVSGFRRRNFKLTENVLSETREEVVSVFPQESWSGVLSRNPDRTRDRHSQTPRERSSHSVDTLEVFPRTRVQRGTSQSFRLVVKTHHIYK